MALPNGIVNGRIVQYVIDENKTTRPAIIVNDWNNQLEDGMINLVVFHDGKNDHVSSELVVWKTSIRFSETKEINTWHFPERK